MKKYTLLILFFLIFVKSHAQYDEWKCGAPDHTHEQKQELLEQLERLRSSRVAIDVGEMTYIPIKPHIVRRDDGTGGLPMADVNSMVAWLNKYYKGSFMEFYITGEPNYIDRTQYYNFDQGEEPGLANNNDVRDAVNVYFVGTLFGGNGCSGTMGYAYMPFDAVGSTRILMRNCGVAVGTTMIHEVGHFFGLAHTFEGTGKAGMDWSYNPNAFTAENVARTGSQANCDVAGDGFCDTNADPGANFRNPNWNRQTCTYTGNSRDRHGVLYEPPIRNIMSYYSGCQDRFSAEQYRAMEDFLLVRKSHRSYSFSDPFDNVPVPQNIGGLAINGVVQIKWQDVADGTGTDIEGNPFVNETGYLIERSESPDDGFLCLGGGGVGPNVEQYTDMTAEKGKTYYYRVKPSNGNGSIYSDVVEVEVVDKCLPHFSENCDGGKIRGFTIARNDNKNEVLENLNSGCQSYRRDNSTNYNYQNFKSSVELAYLGIDLDYDYEILKDERLTYSTIWIDGNQNGTFEDNEKILDNATTSTGTFTVPRPAIEGEMVLRVVSSNSLINGPCEGYNSGEAEDYLVKVTSSGLPCAITKIESVAGSQTACVEQTNFYTQEVRVHYTDNPTEGKLVVNKQEFDITGSPQVVTLVNLPATGALVDVNAYFTKDVLFCNSTFEDVFQAPERCSTCEIVSVTVEEEITPFEECNPDNNIYSKELTITYTDEEVITGKLVVNDQKFDVTPSPMVVTLENLNSDGLPVDIEVYFEEKPGCAWVADELFVAPETCLACRVWDIALDEEGEVSACDPLTNRFYADIIVDYQKPPESGKLIVNGQRFDITESPQKLRITGLVADGMSIPFEAYFENDEECRRFVEIGQAPENCEPCEILSLTDGGIVSECVPATNTYKRKLVLNHKKAPEDGDILVEVSDVPGIFRFPVVRSTNNEFTSEQELILELPADLLQHEVTVSFEGDDECMAIFEELFISPEGCEPCEILSVTAVNQTECNPITNKYSQDLQIEYIHPPKTGQIEVNGKLFDVFFSPMTVRLDDLDADGEPVDVNVRFVEDGTDGPCTFFEQGLFSAPESCRPCEANNIEMVELSECNPENNTYSFAFDFEYVQPPKNSFIKVLGKGIDEEVEVTGSPQRIEIEGVEATGQTMGISVFFSENTECIIEREIFFRSPNPCVSCVIETVELGDQSSCDPFTNTFSQDIIVEYDNAPTEGYLIVNGEKHFIETSPQIVTLKGLPSDGELKDISVLFSEAEECVFEAEGFIKAPEPCHDCEIISVEAVEQSICDPTTNTYTQKLLVEYEGVEAGSIMIVNDQEFVIESSPQEITLSDLNSDGQAVHVDLKIDGTDCKYFKESLFIAPENCEPCDIFDITITGVGECDPETGTYDQEVFIHFDKHPAGGKLIVNEQEFEIGESPQKIVLSGLNSDGNPVDLIARFSENEECVKLVESAYVAPVDCGICEISQVEIGEQGICDPLTSTYSQEVYVVYEFAPNSGVLVVNEQEFEITGSPQKVILEALETNGASVDLNVYFSEKDDCEFNLEEAFESPSTCAPCMINDIKLVEQGSCDPETNTFEAMVEVSFENAPSHGSLFVNGQEFEIEESPQLVQLNGLEANGQPLDIDAMFTASPNCVYEASELIQAPAECSKCNILEATVIEVGECSPMSNGYGVSVKIAYEHAPDGAKLKVNDQLFELEESPMIVELTGLDADGKYHDLNIDFDNSEACSLIIEEAYKAPGNCEPCIINEVNVVENTACNPLTNQFNLYVSVSYDHAPETGELVVNGQSFEISKSPQVVMLEGLDSDGLAHDIEVEFSENQACSYLLEDAYVAPESCLICEISSLEVIEVGECNGANDEYSATLRVAHENADNAGVLIISGAEFHKELEVTASPMDIEINQLKADGKDVDVIAYFSENEECSIMKTKLFRAPESCEDCLISSVVLGDQSTCDPLTNKYSQTIYVEFENVGDTDILVVNGEEFELQTSPQKVVLENLEANGISKDLTVYVKDNEQCIFTREEFLESPEPCPPCEITSISLGEQEACNSETNTFKQELIIEFENAPSHGVLLVNDQEFVVEESPARVILDELESNGNSLDVKAKFYGSECEYEVDGLINSPEACLNCQITDVTFEELGTCKDGLFAQEIFVHYKHAPNDGYLIVNGDVYQATGSPQSILLENLNADGEPLAVEVRMDGIPECAYNNESLLIAPECEMPACEILNVEIKEQTSCMAGSNTYSQVLQVHYEHKSNTGELVINGQRFSVLESPQIVVLEELVADGGSVDLSVEFSDGNCQYEVLDAFNSPESCDACEIYAVEVVEPIANCDGLNESFDQKVLVYYENAPNTGSLVVNGQSYSIESSPQIVELKNLKSDGKFVSIDAYFSEKENCLFNENNLFRAPECTNSDCAIMGIDVVEVDACDPNTKEHAIVAIVEYDNAPEYGYLVVEGVSFEYDYRQNSQRIHLEGLFADGRTHQLQAYFSEKPSCVYEEEEAYQAPIPCEVEEEDKPLIKSITLGDKTDCADGYRKFYQDIDVAFEGLAGKEVVVNDQTFTLMSSPQTLKVKFIGIAGDELGVYAYLKEDPTVNFGLESIVVAPENCGSRLTSIDKVVDLKIYPQPADDQLIIDYPNASILKISVMSIDQQLVIQQEGMVRDNKYKLDVSELPSGIYLLQIIETKKNERSVIKFVVK
ncbi:hypothetical protein AUTU_24930 [Aureibacter tunicatorum]|nr:hypothetical protein AUTU_24930 [Aureibacter tunicatorum]